MRACLLALLASSLVACNADRTAGAAGPLLGEWQWLDTSGGLTGETRSNPEHRWRLRFEADGSVHEEYAGRPPATGRYEAQSSRTNEQGREALVVNLVGEDLVMVDDQPFEVTLVADTLVFGSTIADGFMYRFVRVAS